MKEKPVAAGVCVLVVGWPKEKPVAGAGGAAAGVGAEKELLPDAGAAGGNKELVPVEEPNRLPVPVVPVVAGCCCC